MRVAAVAKAALAEILRKFHKALFYSAETQVVQAEGLHAGAIDQARHPDTVWRSLLVREGCLAAAPAIGRFTVTYRSRALIYPVQPCVGGGVLAGIQRGRYFAGGGLRVGQQRVDQRGFAHAGLSDQHAGVAGQEGA